MKKNIYLFIIVAIVIFIITYFQVVNMQNKKKQVEKFNSEFEQFTTSSIYGTNLATIINRAVDNNEKNGIQKDEDGFYIDDKENYIEVEINITTNDKTYKMETINKVGVVNFVSNFNLITFKCTNIEYHKNGRISKLVFTQLEN